MQGPSARIVGIAALAAVAAWTGTVLPAQANGPAVSAGPMAGARFLALGIGRSTVIDLPRDAKDVLVANPAIANAVVRSARRAYLIGVAPGQTNIIFFDGEGRQIAAYDIEVGRDASGVREALRRVMPNSSIRVDAVNDSVVLSGEVANAAQAQHAVDAAAKLVGDPEKVVNGLTIRGGEQVMLKVTVAEVQRNVLKQLGIDMNGSVGIGSAVVGFNTQNTFTNGAPNTALLPSYASPNFSIDAQIRAMEQSGVLRTLAEPNLTAISGEPAKFLAGGEFPVVAGRSCDPQTGICETQIQFKEFGVGLNFTPVVLSEGRISLKVATEVSELSREGAILQQGISIPALRVRRASSTVELPSGGALVLGGLLQEQIRHNLTGVPALMNIPILGTLFRSRDYQTGQTELMIVVTPYSVRHTSPGKLAQPTDGFADPDDPSAILLGRLNRIYGGRGEMPKRAYHGSYGFILD
jgi:pilus assembly protein CpaC